MHGYSEQVCIPAILWMMSFCFCDIWHPNAATFILGTIPDKRKRPHFHLNCVMLKLYFYIINICSIKCMILTLPPQTCLSLSCPSDHMKDVPEPPFLVQTMFPKHASLHEPWKSERVSLTLMWPLWSRVGFLWIDEGVENETLEYCWKTAEKCRNGKNIWRDTSYIYIYMTPATYFLLQSVLNLLWLHRS